MRPALHQPKEGNFRVAFSEDDKLAATWSVTTRAVNLWDLATGKELRKLKSPYSWLGHLAFSANGQTVAAAALTDVEDGGRQQQ